MEKSREEVVPSPSPARFQFSFFMVYSLQRMRLGETIFSRDWPLRANWFELYPEFLANRFFISRESYVGIYVPTLSSEVMKGIEAGVKPIPNFKGYLVGNGVSDDQFDGNALAPFAHGIGFISYDLYEEVKKECTENYIDSVNDSCGSKLEKVDRNDEVAIIGLINDAVRKAINAKGESLSWELCTSKIRFSHDARSMIKYHKNLTGKGYWALIYRCVLAFWNRDFLQTLSFY